jgi:acid phosphatase type 7
VWLTDVASSSRVEYAPAEGGETTAVSDATPVTRHVVRIAGLIPGAAYCYRVFSDGAALGGDACFRAPRDPGETTFRFGVIGDTDGVTVPGEIAGRLASADVDLVVHMGDVVYPRGEESRYEEEFFAPLAPLIANVPVLPTLGNHDVMTARGAPYLADFVLPQNDADGSSRFYAFRQGNALFVSVDVESSEFGVGSTQYDWLVRTLSTTDAFWKFVYFHEPPFCSALSNLAVRFILSPVFERAGVDVVFAGHQHLYERTIPIRDFTRTGPGVIYITEGGGGATLFPFSQESYSAEVVDRYGYVVGEIDGGTLTLTALGADGTPFDSVVLQKPFTPPARERPRPIGPGASPDGRRTRAVPDAP